MAVDVPAEFDSLRLTVRRLTASRRQLRLLLIYVDDTR